MEGGPKKKIDNPFHGPGFLYVIGGTIFMGLAGAGAAKLNELGLCVPTTIVVGVPALMWGIKKVITDGFDANI